MFQNVIVYCLIALSIVYIAYTFRKRYSKKNETCDGCAMSKNSTTQKQF